MAPTQTAAAHDEPGEVARHLRRNYAAHSLEGGLFIGGVAFVHPQTVLPRLIEQLGGGDWIIAAAPILLMLGFFLPSLFITHRIEKLSFLKPFVTAVGLVQRLPYLIVGASLWFAAPSEAMMLVLVVAAPLLSGLAGGISVTAWREYVAKSIPPERRASLWAVRFVLGGLIGVLAGQGVSWVLTHLSPTRAYGVLHLLVFAMMMGSFAVFALTREPNIDSHRAHAEPSWWSYARAMGRTIGADRRLRPYLVFRALLSGLYVALPFLSLHALAVLHKPDGYLGRLLACQMLGSVLGNLTGGYLGDRSGGKRIALLSQCGSAAVALAATLISSELGFEALFCALGLALGLGAVAVPTLDLEMSGIEQRMSYQTLIGTSHLVGMIGAVLIAATVRRFSDDFTLLAGISACLSLGSVAFLVGLPEPRARAASLR